LHQFEKPGDEKSIESHPGFEDAIEEKIVLTPIGQEAKR